MVSGSSRSFAAASSLALLDGCAGAVVEEAADAGPLFALDVQLQAPRVQMRPSLEEVQDALAAVAGTVLAAPRELGAWGPQREALAGELLWRPCNATAARFI